jgi:hypothetical protein
MLFALSLFLFTLFLPSPGYLRAPVTSPLPPTPMTGRVSLPRPPCVDRIEGKVLVAHLSTGDAGFTSPLHVQPFVSPPRQRRCAG